MSKNNIPENERVMEKKLKRKARNRRYYLKHQAELQERARIAYRQIGEEKCKATESGLEKSGQEAETSQEAEKNKGREGSAALPVVVAAAAVGAVAFIAALRDQEQPPATTTTPVANQDSYPFDMGGGQIIQVKKS